MTKTHGASRDFRRGITPIVLVAAVVRVVAAAAFDIQRSLAGDAVWYWGVARGLVQGRGFLDPLMSMAAGQPMPTAAHPPLYALALTVPPLLGAPSVLAARIWSGMFGVVTVVLIGLLARELDPQGPDTARAQRTGLVAAVLAALFTDLWVQDVILMSEGLYALIVVWLVLVAYRHLRKARSRHAALLGVLVGAATMTRAEGLLLFGLLVVPVLFLASGVTWIRAARAAVLAAMTTVITLMPWAVYNHGRFAHPVVLTTTPGHLLAWANCDTAWYGHDTGGWTHFCVPPDLGRDPTVVDRELRDVGLRYVRDHLSRLPVVLVFRVLRQLGLWQPMRAAAADLQLYGDGRPLAALAIVQYGAYATLAVAGAYVLRRHRLTLLPAGAILCFTVLLALMAYGTLRFRIGLDAMLCPLAAVALVEYGERRRARAA